MKPADLSPTWWKTALRTRVTHWSRGAVQRGARRCWRYPTITPPRRSSRAHDSAMIGLTHLPPDTRVLANTGLQRTPASRSLGSEDGYCDGAACARPL